MLSLWQQFELSTTSLLREMRRECASPSSAMKKTKMRRRRLEAVARDSRGRSTTCTHMAPRIQIEKNDAATRVALWLQRRPRGLCLKRWLGGGSLNAVLLARACQGLFFFFPTLEGTRREKTEEEVARYFDNVSAARKGRVALFTLAAGASRRSDAVLFVDITAQRRPGARR